MKKKVLTGWVIVTEKDGRLQTYDEFGFRIFYIKRDANCFLLSTEKVIKVKITVEPV